MIDPASIRGLSREQLLQFRNFDFDCENHCCEECPLGMEPAKETLNDGTVYYYHCAFAYAAYLYST